MNNDLLCPVCRKKGEEALMIEEHDMIKCPKCNTSFFITGKIPLERYFDEWKKNATNVFPMLRPEIYQHDLPIPNLFFLYEDCYFTLLIGRHNASIVLMGVLLEAVMKERIRLKLGKELRQGYGSCLEVIERNKLMDANDILFLRKFKDKIRNPYAHADETMIVEGVLVPVWEIPIEKVVSPSEFEKVMSKIKTGDFKPKLMPATSPMLRGIIKREYDQRAAMTLFNQVYDFLIIAKMKYFRQEEYDEYNRMFGKPT